MQLSNRTKPPRTSPLRSSSRTDSKDMSVPASPQRISQTLKNPQRNSPQTRRPSAKQARLGDDRLEGDVWGGAERDETCDGDGKWRQKTQWIFVANADEVRKLSRAVDKRSQHATFLANRRDPRFTEPLEQHLHALPVRPATDLLQKRSAEENELHLQRQNFPRQLSNFESSGWKDVRRESEECAANVLWDTRQVVRLLFPFELKQVAVPQHTVSWTSILRCQFVRFGTRAGTRRWQFIRRCQRPSWIWRTWHRRWPAVPKYHRKHSVKRLNGVADEAAKIQRHAAKETTKAFERCSIANHYRLQSVVDLIEHEQKTSGKLVPKVEKHQQHTITVTDSSPARRHSNCAINSEPFRQQLVVAKFTGQLSTAEVQRRGGDVLRWRGRRWNFIIILVGLRFIITWTRFFFPLSNHSQFHFQTTRTTF